jgi:hypothetical protein
MNNQNWKNILLLLWIIILNKIVKGEEIPKVTNLQMSEDEGFQVMENENVFKFLINYFKLYQHWTEQALASLMSAFLQTKSEKGDNSILI